MIPFHGTGPCPLLGRGLLQCRLLLSAFFGQCKLMQKAHLVGIHRSAYELLCCVNPRLPRPIISMETRVKCGIRHRSSKILEARCFLMEVLENLICKPIGIMPSSGVLRGWGCAIPRVFPSFFFMLSQKN